MTKIFQIKIHVKKPKIDSLLNFGSQDNVIMVDMVNKI
jgi:hypothetical protein